MTRRWALLAALARAGAVWPRVELPGAWLHAVHVPKAGGTTLDRALMRVHCFLGGDEAACLKRCTERDGASKAHVLPPCKTAGNGHRPALHRCHDAYGVADAYGAARLLPAREPCGAGATDADRARCALCGASLRDPWTRALSAWFYKGHNPWWDRYGVGWPPVHGFVDDESRRPDDHRRRRLVALFAHAWTDKAGVARTATFADYARTRAYADVAVRMLGDHGMAYDGRIRPDGASLARALAVLARVPFVVFEAFDDSLLLLARAYTNSSRSCAALADRLRPLGARNARPTDAATLQRRGAIAANASLRAAFERANGLDRRLYDGAVRIWCAEWARAASDPCLQHRPPPVICR